eukprot:TRINITY_DN6541_c0_g1_i1.p1 TRINITY_DN6541_c0_g1~~TRINITY_DN6541_c0_g1_i1.p1  ORF type:complete len:144 (+),score=6.69 TRINITY_DN6541_c0_g1_i1:51-482(+)
MNMYKEPCTSILVTSKWNLSFDRVYLFAFNGEEERIGTQPVMLSRLRRLWKKAALQSFDGAYLISIYDPLFDPSRNRVELCIVAPHVTQEEAVYEASTVKLELKSNRQPGISSVSVADFKKPVFERGLTGPDEVQVQITATKV